MTIGEVKTSDDLTSESVLIVVDGIKYSKKNNSISTKPGRLRIWRNWIPEQDRLSPIRYRYLVPPGPKKLGTTNSNSLQHVRTILRNKSIVLTGKFDDFSRVDMENEIKKRGGYSPKRVSKTTFALVVGRKPTASKVAKARQLKIPRINGKQFYELLHLGEIRKQNKKTKKIQQ